MVEERRVTRRSLLKAASSALVLGGMGTLGLEMPIRTGSAAQGDAQPPLVWVWKFSADGSLPQILETLTSNRLGIIMKTHDGTEWMQRYDHSSDAIDGPAQVERLANLFESAGVPFHTWCVVQGKDPMAEARMCADVLSAGARSVFLDLEPPEGGNYWQGPWENALIFGEELRRRAPNSWLAVAPDARPWQLEAVPMNEFMSFANAVAPQAYWATFDGPTNRRFFQEHGYPVTSEGVTPELVVQASHRTFSQFGLPIQPIGQGASTPDMWHRFVSAAAGAGMNPVSLWRYGTADPSAFSVLGAIRQKPRTPAPVVQAPERESTVQGATVGTPSGPSPAEEVEAPQQGSSSLTRNVWHHKAVSTDRFPHLGDRGSFQQRLNGLFGR